MSVGRMNETGEATQFGRWLSGQRKARDLTQEDLAERLGCSLSAIQKIELGSRRPSRQVAEILADYFGIAPEERGAFVHFARGQREGTDERESPPTRAFSRPSPRTGTYASGPNNPTNPTNLPSQLTSFVGRDAELPRLRDLMLTAEVRLLTLTGPPGTGKTRLALEAAGQLLRDFEGGVFLVSLAPISDPGLVMPEIARSLGLGSAGARSPFQVVQESVRNKRMILVLDNFEQVIEAARLVAELLMAAPGLKVLATSRVALHVRGEREISMPPLHLPDPEHLPPLDRLSRNEAVQLFVQRAIDVDAGFELTDENASAVARICARLDGLPLAIELASARVKVLTPEAILGRLENSLSLLTGGPRDLPARQRTLRGAIEWSYDLLDDAEKRLFGRLGAFVGGCTLKAVEQVCFSASASEAPAVDPLEGVTSLVGKSLLKRHDAQRGHPASGAEPGRRGQDGSEPRFTMLETIREYAQERLEDSGEAGTIGRHHAEFFVRFVERAAREIWGRSVSDWVERIEQELGNLRAAMEWSLRHERAEMAALIAGPLYRFWFVHGRSAEALAWLERILAARDQLTPTALAHVLGTAGNLIGGQGDQTRGDMLLGESLSLYRALGDRAGVALALNRMGLAASARANYGQAIAFWEESLALRREMGDYPGIAQSLMNIGAARSVQGENAKAETMLEESRVLFGELGDEIGLSLTHIDLAENALRRAEHTRAESMAKRALQFSRRLRSDALAVDALGLLATIWVDQGKAQEALVLLAALDASSEAGEPSSPTLFHTEHDQTASAASAARAQMPGDTAAALWEEGRAMSVDQAVSYALLHARSG